MIDTSNEMAGSGKIPHSCIGNARRMMVPSIEVQAKTMVQCVQNHTPRVLVVDEIGRAKEVEAARTSKYRGVRMIATAHGSLRSLINNKELRGLVGGLETVTVGDEEARKQKKKRSLKEICKQKTIRACPPVFDIVIDVNGENNEWVIIKDTASAVDDILDEKEHYAECRHRCKDTGNVKVGSVLI